MKKKFRGISLLIVILLVTTFISIKTSEASDVATQPNFTIQNLKATPDPAKVGEDILVTGQIVPQDFESTIPPKEIVLVLDTSGSMKGIKLTNLKEAAKSFIKTMKDVPNLKIGIVAYSTEATINPIERYGTKEIEVIRNGKNSISEVNDYKLLDNNFIVPKDESGFNNLNKIINQITAIGGTNTGEGLRKALYMLKEGEKNANKTIVLMSDGLPTYASSSIFIDSLDHGIISGKGTGENDTDSLNYAKKIGGIVKEKGYNSYSIGYGLSDKGTNYFKQIHSSMKGLPSNTEANETNGFFEKDNGSITAIFNQIAENIKSSYDLNEVSLEIEFNDNFNLNIGGNEVNIGNINYKKISSDDYIKENGKAIYHADPINFNFIVKANQAGEEQSIFNEVYVNFPWNNESLKVNTNSELKVEVILNELPYISAKLISPSQVNINSEEPFNLEYEIDALDFNYNDTGKIVGSDIVIVLDISKDMEAGGKFDFAKDAIFDNLFNNSELENKNIKYSIITYNNKAITKSDLSDNISNLKESLNEIVPYDNNAGKITDTIPKIKEVLTNSSSERKKNIIFISSGVSNDQVTVTEDMKDWNIITMALTGKKDEDSNHIKTLKSFHKNLGGKEGDFLISYMENGENSDIKDILMTEVSNKITSGITYESYVFEPIINISLNGNFDVVEGATVISEDKNKVTIKLPKVVYNYISDGNYKADKIEDVKLRLRPKANKFGILNFGEKINNNIQYENLLAKQVTVLLNTPIVTVKEKVKDLVHGLYEGIENDEINIYSPLEGNEIIISPGATVTFGAKFITSNDDFELTLDGDSKFNKIETSDIKVYKLDKTNNSLVEITNPKDETNEKNLIITNPEDNKFIIKASNLNNNSEDTEIVVIYKGRIEEKSENESFINSVTISDLYAEVRIKAGSSSNSNNEENKDDYQGVLPDLF